MRRYSRPATLQLLLLAPVIAADAATAPQASDHGSELEEIIVTAQLQPQNLQEIPLAISVVDGASIAQRNIVRLPDLAKSVPNASLQEGGSGAGKTAQVFIRAVGQADYQYVVEPGVGVYRNTVRQEHDRRGGTSYLTEAKGHAA